METYITVQPDFCKNVLKYR